MVRMESSIKKYYKVYEQRARVVVEGGGGSKWWQRDGMEVGDDEVVMMDVDGSDGGVGCGGYGAWRRVSLLIVKTTRSKATLNEPSSPGTSSGSGPRCQETMGDTIAQTRFENVSKLSNDSLLARARVESSSDDESLSKDASKQGRINASDADKDITLVSVHDMNVSADEEVGEEEVVEVINTAKLIIDAAQVSAAGDKVSTAGAATTSQSQDKGKGIWVEPVQMKKKDQISFDEETALKLQAEFDEEERLARESAKKEQEANIALIETWDDIQAKIDVDPT
ncbi:hypothetical protein Tco_0589343 [Tanacetum coccineum]